MKKNILLASLFILAIIITYIVKVKFFIPWDPPLSIFAKSMDTIIRHDFKSLSWSYSKVLLQKKEKEYLVLAPNAPSYNASLKQVEELISRFGYLQVERNVDSNNQLIPDNSLKIELIDNENKKWTHVFGPSNVTGSGMFYAIFYDNKKYLFVIKDVWSDKRVFSNESEMNQYTYQNLKKIFELDASKLYDLSLFKDIQNISSIKIRNTWNRPYEILFDPISILPAQPNGIDLIADISQIPSQVPHFKSKNIHFLDTFNWSAPWECEIVFNYGEKKQQKKDYLLTRHWNNKLGYYLWPVGEKILFELTYDQSRFFYLPVTDFWDKRIFGSKNKHPYSEKFDLILNNRRIKIRENSETQNFDLIDNNYTLNQNNIKMIFNLLWADNGYPQASYIIDEEKEIKNYNILIEFDKFKIGIYLKDKNLKIYDSRHSHVLVYPFEKIDDALRPKIKIEDYITKN